MKSNFWNKMNIYRKSIRRRTNNLYISTDPPPVFADRNSYIFEVYDETSSDEEIKEICDFHNSEYYDLGKNRVKIDLDIQELKNYIDLGSQICLLRNKQNQIICMCLKIHLPTKMDTSLNINSIEYSEKYKSIVGDSLLLGVCTNYIAKSEYRKKGFGAALLQESINFFYNGGGLGALFVNYTSRSDNSVPLNYWTIPFCTKKDCYDVQKVNEKKSEETLNYYLSKVSNKKFYFSPSLDYWKKWISFFPTYVIYNKENKIESLCSCSISKTLVKNIKSNTCYLKLFVGEKDTLSTLFGQLGKDGYDNIYVRELGELTESVLLSLNAQRTGKKYINFYNMQMYVKPTDFFVPLF